MSRIIGTSSEHRLRDIRRFHTPLLTTIAAILLSVLPIVSQAPPTIPDLGFMVLLSWRLLRPEAWTPRTALLLGLLNDFVTGHPLGHSMAIWTLVFLAFDFIESRVGFKDYWLDWFFAAVAIIFYTSSSWYVAHMMGNRLDFSVMLPQMIISVLAFPIVGRIVLAFDRWRLAR
jgi:rod shape-determining protein MreD